MAMNPRDPHDLRLVITDVAAASPNKGEFFAVDANNAAGVPIPAFRTGPSLPPTGNLAGEGYFVTTSNRGYVWDGSNWQDVTPNPIKSYATDAALIADVTQAPGSYATTQDTGNLYIKIGANWKQLNTRQYPTVAAMVADSPPLQTLAEVDADGSLWEFRDPGGSGAQWTCTVPRELPNLAAIQAWNVATMTGDTATALDNGIRYVRFATGWKPVSIWEDTEANILAATWALNGQNAIATDTLNSFIRSSGAWVQDPIQHFATDALLQAATPPDGTLAWADDTGNVYARVGTTWKGLNTGFADPIPIGSISAFPSRTIPSGWLACDGSAVPTGTTYDELRTLLGAGNNLPDLQGEFLRGAKAGDTVMAHKQWSTARPRTVFRTNVSGNHFHRPWIYTESMNMALFDHPAALGTAEAQGHKWGYQKMGSFGNQLIESAGNHSHDVSAGGDSETAPDHTLIVWCIKASHATIIPSALSMVFAESSPKDGQQLTYDAASASWKNKDPLKVQSMTQAAYDALPTKDAATLYLITGP